MSDLENEVEVRRTSRRRQYQRSAGRAVALEKLAEARRSGKVHRPDVDSLVQDVYEEVDEEEYNEIVRKRKAADFVVDDGSASEYIDTGRDIFDDDDEEDEIDGFSSGPKAKKSKKEKKEKKTKGKLDSYFASASSRGVVKDESQLKLDNDDLLNSMLAEIGNDTTSAPSPCLSNVNPFARSSGFNNSKTDSSTLTPRPVSKNVALTTRRSDKIDFTVKRSVPEAQIKPGIVPIRDKIQAQVAEPDDDDFGVTDEIDYPDTVISAPFEASIETPKEEIPTLEIEENADVSKPILITTQNESLLQETAWEAKEEESQCDIEVISGNEDFYVEVEGHKFIRVYYLDAYEDPVKHPGTVYLFGRVAISKNLWKSCCIVVKNIERQIFVTPTSDDLSAVFNEVCKVLKEDHGIPHVRQRNVMKKFMNDGTVNAEYGEEQSVMEVRYDSAYSKLPADLHGKTFSGVHNTTTTALERLLVECSILGPGWLEISNYTQKSPLSYCDYEFTVDMNMAKMKDIKYNNKDNFPVPSVRMMAINVITALKGRENEICMISLISNDRCDLNNPSVETKQLSRLALVCNPSTVTFPLDFATALKNSGMSSFFKKAGSEKALLSLFLAELKKRDPDLLVGHDLAATMELLKTRMQRCNVQDWSRTSRLKRSAALSSVKSNKAGQWELTAGRLLLDSRLAAMELFRSRSYDLEELGHQIVPSMKRQNVFANEVAAMYKDSSRLLNFINWSFADPLLSLNILVHLKALPLFMQITNIVGGVMSRTLMGGRAERNEYLLLHAFHRSNIIAPNKYQPVYSKKDKEVKKKEIADGDAEGESGEQADDGAHGKNKAQYAGGLVLDPIKGLYDTLILLLDFNSLYPSIIQEYNICFTTVKHTKDGNDLPDLPEASLSEGVLPREIRGLVERRRQVKAAMKDRGVSEAQKKQLDIRQMALKLTANSMYGCLGFQQSRFYAKPLAALITSKGREILMQSKELVERMGYCVVYGDTDSIMINTNSTDLQQAKQLGFEIKKQVNKFFRLLELDLDGIFKRMLLLKKKKYAALTVNPDNENETKKELKGLDIVRRDWSKLAKDTGTDVVDVILNPSMSREELVSEIKDLLAKVRHDLDQGKIPMEKFEISKQLTRNPKDYADLKSQPHASVAMRLNSSGKFNLKHGDIVEYIICDDGSSNSAAQRAYHRSELQENDKLKIDHHYYLAQQIHPVVSRLCAPIEETDAVFIAEALGMDPTSYRRSAAAQAAAAAASGEDQYGWMGPITFDHCDSLNIPCPGENCDNILRYRESIIEKEVPVFAFRQCEKCGCSPYQSSAYIQNHLDNNLAQFVGKHLSTSFKCDDAVCEFETTGHPLKWCREGLECPKCSGGILRKKYSTRELFDQQTFLRQIVDFRTALLKANPETKRALEFQAGHGELMRFSDNLVKTVDRYLSKNAYNRVDLSYLFAPMLKL